MKKLSVRVSEELYQELIKYSNEMQLSFFEIIRGCIRKRIKDKNIENIEPADETRASSHLS